MDAITLAEHYAKEWGLEPYQREHLTRLLAPALVDAHQAGERAGLARAAGVAKSWGDSILRQQREGPPEDVEGFEECAETVYSMEAAIRALEVSDG